MLTSKLAIAKTIIILFCGWFLSYSTAAQSRPIHLTGIPFPLSWENKPLHYSIKGPVLTIEAGAKTDMFRDPNVTYNTDNAPKLLFTADKDFILSARIEHGFNNKWDGGAIVMKADAMHWIKFCFEKDYTGMHRVVSVVTNDASDDCNSVSSGQNYIYYKMAKAGNVITLYFSNDQKKWFLIRHLQFNAKGPLMPAFWRNRPREQTIALLFPTYHINIKKLKTLIPVNS